MIAEGMEIKDLETLDERTDEELEEILKRFSENGASHAVDLKAYGERRDRQLKEERQRGMAWYERLAEALGPLVGRTQERYVARTIGAMERHKEHMEERYQSMRAQLKESHERLQEAHRQEVVQQHRFDAGQELYVRIKASVEEAEAEINNLPKSRATIALYEAHERLTDLRKQAIDVEMTTMDAQEAFEESIRNKSYLEAESQELRRETTKINIQRNAFTREIKRWRRIQEREFGRDGAMSTKEVYERAGELTQQMERGASRYLSGSYRGLDATYAIGETEPIHHPSLERWKRIRST